ncbi:glucan-binding YG repeat protein [Aequitasia blattaphilus]|uniref:Uncharacterized protein n=1 Tax=Aequitasia blattaphilus TaxID=2949332 RepID=A0ABT1E8Y5_9FIRM|nr:hypothetical protein [Aequitasia blattaphilus]MCP1102228.1 hypothetical protein [Aequitasia blattaphilus]MCR8614868.1 hypothetical protein [Aequitasia blattaphilus]
MVQKKKRFYLLILCISLLCENARYVFAEETVPPVSTKTTDTDEELKEDKRTGEDEYGLTEEENMSNSNLEEKNTIISNTDSETDESNVKSIRNITIKNQWIFDSNVGRWWYRHSNGNYTINGWEFIAGKWYYFDNLGYMCVGWRYVSGAWYYLDASGAMHTGWRQIGVTWYYFNSSGSMHIGWLQQGTTWYYLSASGAMRIGWLQQGAAWYYFNSSGSMLTGWHTISGVLYYFNSSGSMVERKMKVSRKRQTFTFAVPEGGWSTATAELIYQENYIKAGSSSHFLERDASVLYNVSGATSTPSVHMGTINHSNGRNFSKYSDLSIIFDSSQWLSGYGLKNTERVIYANNAGITGVLRAVIFCSSALVPSKGMSTSQSLNTK